MQVQVLRSRYVSLLVTQRITYKWTNKLLQKAFPLLGASNRCLSLPVCESAWLLRLFHFHLRSGTPASEQDIRLHHEY